jgi:hypothetical protein
MPEVPERPQRDSKAFETAVSSLGKLMHQTRCKLLRAKAHQIAMNSGKKAGMYIRSKPGS